MPARILGMGWVTPLGADLATVWQRLAAAEPPEPKVLTNPETGALHSYLAVPPKLVDHLARNPRLRRSSAISYYAVAAGLAALEDAGLTLDAASASRTAVVFAICDGGVIYTRKFYEQIVKQGANAASPLLFPETVYNAPASHLSALLGIDGASYTLVGDNSVGLAALKFAEQLLALSDIDHVIVVGAEEIDWVICEAYRDWRLARTSAPPRADAPWKAWLGEGAAALVLAREGSIAVEAVHTGVAFQRRADAPGAIDRVLAELATGGDAQRMMSCANGTFADPAEAAAVARHFPTAMQHSLKLKRSLGEAPGASALLQVIAAACECRLGQSERVLVPVMGFNQQASAAIIARAG
ncbi:MAG: beta-ketoacyl synthase N-terminal-like domain-containing protein [Chthoniobacteraceae bacterium]